MGSPRARAPKHAVERRIQHGPLWNIQQKPVAGQRARHRGELAFLRVHRLSQDHLKDLRVRGLGSRQVREDHASRRQIRVEFNCLPSAAEDHLAAMLVRHQWFQQLLRHRRLPCAPELKLGGRHRLEVRAPPSFLADVRNGHAGEGVPGALTILGGVAGSGGDVLPRKGEALAAAGSPMASRYDNSGFLLHFFFDFSSPRL